MDKNLEIERSIIKKYRKEIWRRFVRAVESYKLVQDGDCIAVCISGGKDSFLMAKCFQELKRHGKIKFDLKFIVMDPGYKEINRNLIEENAKLLNIPIQIFNSSIFEIVNNEGGSPCYLCARMRRGHLYSYAKELGCNKIALGHHYDDMIETILLSMFYGGEFKTMIPKLHSSNFEGMELIRPMYLIKEKDIISWVNYHNLKFLNCACRFTEKNANNEIASKRQEMKELINNLRKVDKNIDHNIFKSAENVNLDAIIAYRKDGVLHSFLETYDEE